jgi:hypothetical protein
MLLVGGRVWGPHANARSYLWLYVASADNQIGNEGAGALAYALKTNSSLQALGLGGEYGGRGGEGLREERGWVAGLGDARSRGYMCGMVCAFERVWMECIQATDSFLRYCYTRSFQPTATSQRRLSVRFQVLRDEESASEFDASSSIRVSQY